MKNKILLVLSILLGLGFIIFGLNKFYPFMPMPKDIPEASMKDMQAFMEISWLMPLVGFIEVLAGILIMIPKTRALGAIVLLPVMVGILLHNTVVDKSGLPIAGVLSAILLWIILESMDKYKAMIK